MSVRNDHLITDLNRDFFNASNILDGNPSTFYHSPPNKDDNDWLQVDLGQRLRIDSVVILGRQLRELGDYVYRRSFIKVNVWTIGDV